MVSCIDVHLWAVSVNPLFISLHISKFRAYKNAPPCNIRKQGTGCILCLRAWATLYPCFAQEFKLRRNWAQSVNWWISPWDPVTQIWVHWCHRERGWLTPDIIWLWKKDDLECQLEDVNTFLCLTSESERDVRVLQMSPSKIIKQSYGKNYPKVRSINWPKGPQQA